MLASLAEGLLARHRHVGTASVPRTRIFDNGRLLTPTMMEDIWRGYDVRHSVLVKMRKSDELNATVDGPTPNESDAANRRKVKDTPKRIFHEKVKNLDSSQSMNLADSSGIKTPNLVHLMNSPVNASDELSDAHVAVGVLDKDRGRRTRLHKSGGATATHDDEYRISENERLKELNIHIDFEIFKTREQANMEREIIKRENIEREILT